MGRISGQAGLLHPPVLICVPFFSFLSFFSYHFTGSTVFFSFTLLFFLFVFLFGFGLSFTSSSLSSPGLLLAMKVSKETLTCFFVSSMPHLLAAPSTRLFDSSAPPVLKIPRSFSLSSSALESTVEPVGPADSNTAAFCGHWNIVKPSQVPQPTCYWKWV